MKVLRRIKVAFILLIAFLATLSISSCARQPSKFNPSTMIAYEVTRGDLSEVISISGNLKEGDERKLSFPATVSGRIVEVDVEEGQKVGAGDMLARVDDAKQQLSLDQAEAALSQAQSSVNTARINYQAALDSNHTTVQISQSNYELAKKQVGAARNQLSAAQDSLYYTKKQLIEAQNYYNEVLRYNNSQTWDTEAEKHAAELNEINARASMALQEKAYIAALDAITSAQDSLAQAKESRDASYYSMIEQQQSSEAQIKLTSIAIDSALAAYSSAEASLELARISLSDTTLITPVSGIISDLSFRAGEQVSISSYVSIVDLSRLHIEALVDEIDVVKLKIGDEVDISFDAYPADLIGGIATYIAPTSTDLQGVVTYLVKFELEGYGELALKPGMTANIDVSITTATGVLSVPNDAILDRDGKSYVKLLTEDDRIVDVEVEIGYVSVDNTEITSGLTEGDRVTAEKK